MNILFLTNKSAFQDVVFGGAESSIRSLAENLVNAGHSVDYVTKNREGCFLPYIEQVNFGEINLHIFHTTYGYQRFYFVRKMNDWLLQRQLKSLIEYRKIELAYCFYELENVQTLLLLRSFFVHLKIVLRMAGVQWYDKCLINPKLIPIYGTLFNSVDAVNHISSGLQKLVRNCLSKLSMHVQFKREFVIDIGSSVRPGRLLSYDSLPNKTFCMVMATRFSAVKRQDILVKALALIDQKYRINLKLIGNGSERGKIEQLVKDLGISDRVQFLPFMPQEELWKELQLNHILCHSCDHEGLGKIIVESMAVGLPVLVSDVLPLNSFIHEGHNGFLVENSPKQWAKKIVDLIENYDVRSEVSRQSMNWIIDNYTPSKNIKVYINEFQELIDS